MYMSHQRQQDLTQDVSDKAGHLARRGGTLGVLKDTLFTL